MRNRSRQVLPTRANKREKDVRSQVVSWDLKLHHIHRIILRRVRKRRRFSPRLCGVLRGQLSVSCHPFTVRSKVFRDAQNCRQSTIYYIPSVDSFQNDFVWSRPVAKQLRDLLQDKTDASLERAFRDLHSLPRNY